MQIMQQEVALGWWDPAIFAEFRRVVEEEGFETPARPPGTTAAPAPALMTVS